MSSGEACHDNRTLAPHCGAAFTCLGDRCRCQLGLLSDGTLAGGFDEDRVHLQIQQMLEYLLGDRVRSQR